MPTMETEFEVLCAICGADLNDNVAIKDARSYGPRVTVQPCQQCLQDAEDDGDDKGYERGYKEGKTEGYDEGYEEGLQGGVAE